MAQLLQNSKTSAQSGVHILVVSFPLQGHTAPLIKLSHQISRCGAKVTFVTTEFVHGRMAAAMPLITRSQSLRVVSVPDGLGPEDDRNDKRKVHESIYKVLPGHLMEILMKNNPWGNGDKITGVIIDSPLALLLEIPKKMGIKTAIFWVSSPGCLALGLSIPKLIEAQVMDENGTPLKNEKIQLMQNMPAMSTTELLWYFPFDLNRQREMFQFFQGMVPQIKNSDFVICNWFHDLHPSAFDLLPNLLPVGPLLSHGQSAGSFFSEDSNCLSWLDKQPPNSVVYVAFGSTSRFSKQQLEELTMGLEAMGRPFLWVAWSGLTDGSFPVYSDEFKERVANWGKIVDWAPQELVLAHPSIACFLTHCGWGSVMESLTSGVPFVCWPYFGDQLYTQTYICEAWKVGLRLEPDNKGIVRRSEIKQKIEQVLSNGIMRENSLRFKEMARKSTSEGGSSLKNLEYLIEQMK